MAEQLTNATVSPSAVTSSSVTAGSTTSFTVTSASLLPTSGTFSVIFRGAATDGSGDSIARVGSVSGTTLSSVTWEVTAAGSPTYASGTEIDLDLSADALDSFAIPRAGGTAQGYIDFDNSGASGILFDGGTSGQIDTTLGLFFSNGNQFAPYTLNIGDPTASVISVAPLYAYATAFFAQIGLDNSLDPTSSMSGNTVIDPTMGSIFLPNSSLLGSYVYLNNDALAAPWLLFIRNAGSIQIRVNADPLSSGTMDTGTYYTMNPGDQRAFCFLSGVYYRFY